MTKVKICGITNKDDAQLAVQQGADALGFIFVKKSPRYITPEAARNIVHTIGPFVCPVGVFKDERAAVVKNTAQTVGLSVIQLHGNESPRYCQELGSQFRIIKTLFPHDRPFTDKIKQYKLNAFLFDIPFEEKQDGLKTLSLDILQEIQAITAGPYQIIISGGLTPDNVNKVLAYGPYAVDVASGVEAVPGKKDPRLVQQFIEKATSRGKL